MAKKQVNIVAVDMSTLKIPKIRKDGVASRRYRIDNWDVVPLSLTEHLSEFRKIGKNIFVKVASNIDADVKLENMTLGQLAKTYSSGISIGLIRRRIAEQAKVKLVRATPEQLAKYEAAQARLNAFLLAYAINKETKRLQRIEGEVTEAYATLKKYKRGPFAENPADVVAGFEGMGSTKRK